MGEKMESAGAFCIPEAERCQHSWRPGGPPRGRTVKKGRVWGHCFPAAGLRAMACVGDGSWVPESLVRGPSQTL